MSGGAFDYLYSDEIDDLFLKFRDAEDGTLAAMVMALAEYPDAQDAAAETERLRLEMRAFRVRTEAKLQRLRPVWRAVERHHSLDSGPDSVRRAIDEYRDCG